MKIVFIVVLIALTVSHAYALPQCLLEDDLLPNPADCGSYYKCLNGQPILMPCPPGLEWSKELTRCEYPNIAKCIETETVPPTRPTESTPATPSTPRPDHCPEIDGPKDVLLPNPADCGSFYKCLNGVPHLILCPPGQQWSIELNRCDYPEIAKCKETETKPTTVSPHSSSKSPVEKPDHCPAENGPEDVLLPNPKDCGSFYKCWNGIPVLISCPQGQHWSIDLSRCDYPEIAKCKETASKPSGTASSKSNKCPAEDGPEDVSLPNPADCGSFFKCLAGQPILSYCPPGLHWSVEFNRCEYPEVAKCVETEEKPSTIDTTSAPITSKPPPVEKPDHCPAEDGQEDVLLPNPADCGSFFKCLAGQPILSYCPSGLHWSVEFNRCEYPEVAKCEKKYNSYL